MSGNLVFTLCSNNYLAQAITLGNSLLKFNPEYKFLIGLVDRRNEFIDYSKIPYDIIEVENIDLPGFNEMVLRYNIIELNTAVKPGYFKFLFKKFEPESIIYFDPDIQIFSTINSLRAELDNSDILLTPHIFTPINDDKILAEEDFLNSGLYNLGFIALNNTQNSLKMVDWWADRLKTKASIDFKKGLFTDQIWINFVPLFFEKVKILSDHGYNMAYWNLHERRLTIRDNELFVNNHEPLVFYHFSGFNPLSPFKISKYQNRYIFKELPEIEELFKNYSNNLFTNGIEKFLKFQNAFAGIKEKNEKEKRKEEIRKFPWPVRIFRILVLKVSQKYNLLLD